MNNSPLLSLLNPIKLWGILTVSSIISFSILLNFFFHTEQIKDWKEQINSLENENKKRAYERSKFSLNNPPEDLGKKFSSLSFLNEEKKVIHFLGENTYKASVFQKRKEELQNNKLLMMKIGEGNLYHYHEDMWVQITPIQIDHQDLLNILSLVEKVPNNSCFFTEIKFSKKEGFCGNYLEFSSQLLQRYVSPQ